MNRLECSQIVVGKCFNAPVFFDDGENMFLAPNHCVKNYHVACLKRWNVPFLLTDGIEVPYTPPESNQENDLEELEELEDLEELEEL